MKIIITIALMLAFACGAMAEGLAIKGIEIGSSKEASTKLNFQCEGDNCRGEGKYGECDASFTVTLFEEKVINVTVYVLSNCTGGVQTLIERKYGAPTEVKRSASRISKLWVQGENQLMFTATTGAMSISLSNALSRARDKAEMDKIINQKLNDI